MNTEQKGRVKPEPNKVDEASAESFPASDPPSFMGSTAVAGSPQDHPRQGEKDDRAPVVTERVNVNLNTATAEELGGLPALSPELARTLIDNRPFDSWEDLKGLPDFDGDTIAALKKGGAHINR